MVALAAERRRAALTARPKGRDRVRLPTYVRKVVVLVAAGLALLAAGSTAVAAADGDLPHGVQQRAPRLFSALGIPAPRTGTTTSAAAPARQPTPTGTTGRGSEMSEAPAARCVAWKTAAARTSDRPPPRPAPLAARPWRAVLPSPLPAD